MNAYHKRQLNQSFVRVYVKCVVYASRASYYYVVQSKSLYVWCVFSYSISAVDTVAINYVYLEKLNSEMN